MPDSSWFLRVVSRYLWYSSASAPSTKSFDDHLVLSGRSSGVGLEKFQTPCRLGRPSGVRSGVGAGVFAAGADLAPDAAPCPRTSAAEGASRRTGTANAINRQSRVRL